LLSYENIIAERAEMRPVKGQSICAAMNVFFHLRKLINFAMN